MMNVDKVVSQILIKEPETSLMPIKPEWIEIADTQYPGMPDDLRYLYTKYGYGEIGESRYMIHCLLEPSDIYDPITAAGLEGVLIVGDDYAGNCEAYDAANSWQFGSIGSSGKFSPYEGNYSSLVDFLEKWFLTEGDT